MADQELLNRILYRGFLEIRMAVHEGQNDRAYKIADLLHNLPLALQSIVEQRSSGADVIAELRERARIKGYEKWLEHALAEESRHQAARAAQPVI